MIARRLTGKDYPLLEKWWKEWDWTPVAPEALPENGTGGIMIELEDGTPVCAGFLYITNSTIAWVEWIISNKEVRGKQRGEALDMLIAQLIIWAEGAGRKVVFTVAKSMPLVERYKKLGFVLDEKPSYELTKVINI